MDFRREVLRLAKERLRQIGFTAQRGAVAIMLLQDGWYGWIGLNRALHPGVISILTVTGIRCEVVEQLVQTLTPDLPAHPGPSLAQPLYMLVPKRKEPAWSFTEIDNELLEDMINTVITYGLPFMRSLASLEALLSAYESGVSPLPDVTTRLPSVLYLLGRRVEAESYIASQLSTLRATLPKSGVLANYEVFATNFQAM